MHFMAYTESGERPVSRDELIPRDGQSHHDTRALRHRVVNHVLLHGLETTLKTRCFT